MGKGNKGASESNLSLGADPKLSKSADDLELEKMLAEEAAAQGKAGAVEEADAKASKRDDLRDADKPLALTEKLPVVNLPPAGPPSVEPDAGSKPHDFLNDRKDPIRTAEPRLVTKDADSRHEEPAHGPRVRVNRFGSVQWDGAEYEAGSEFTVDTSKHSEKDFDDLVACGALESLD